MVAVVFLLPRPLTVVKSRLHLLSAGGALYAMAFHEKADRNILISQVIHWRHDGLR